MRGPRTAGVGWDPRYPLAQSFGKTSGPLDSLEVIVGSLARAGAVAVVELALSDVPQVKSTSSG